MTRVPRLAIGVSTADCGPVLFADAQARVIGAAHAGWRGALTGVIEATLEAMERCGADRGRIVAALGPMIRQPNYEVGPEFVARFFGGRRRQRALLQPARLARGSRAVRSRRAIIAARLARAGVARIEDIGHCTYADAENFFSYRRSVHRGEPDYGRHVNAIALLD